MDRTTDAPGMGLSTTHKDWIGNLTNEQIVPVGTNILKRISENTTLRDQFVAQVKSDPTLSRMFYTETARL